jgi:hypothetical protein
MERRTFIKLGAGTAMGSVLAACGGDDSSGGPASLPVAHRQARPADDGAFARCPGQLHVQRLVSLRCAGAAHHAGPGTAPPGRAQR